MDPFKDCLLERVPEVVIVPVDERVGDEAELLPHLGNPLVGDVVKL